MSVEDLTGVLLVGSWESRHGHGREDACPGCRAPVSTTALTHLVYTFEVCDCGEPNFDHLLEIPWHRACFSTAPCPGFTPFHVRGARGRPAHDTKECIRCGLTEEWHAVAVLASAAGISREAASGAAPGTESARSLYRSALKLSHPDQGGSRELLEQVQEAGRRLGVA